MANIEYLPNQPIQLYKVSPDPIELSNGQTPWEKTAYHKRLGVCGFIGPDYCHPVLGSDVMNFQFKAATVDDDDFQPFFTTPISTGSATGISLNHLVDAAANFTGDGVAVGNIVVNTSDDLASRVTLVNSATDLTLADDIFSSGGNYEILPVSLSGNFTYDPVGNFFVVSSATPSSVEAAGILTVDQWYKVTINVTDITAGDLQIILGNNIVATINSVGAHVVYGQCTFTPNFQILSSSIFAGSIDAGSILVYELITGYTIGFFDVYNNYIDAHFYAEESDSLTIGNIFVNNIPWETFLPDCGKYIIGIYEGFVEPCSGQMITNGNFGAGVVGWDTGINVTITGGHAEFANAPQDAYLRNLLTCDIVAGNSYTLTYQVSAQGGIKLGQYTIPQAGSPIRDFDTDTSVSITFTAAFPATVLEFLCTDADGCTGQIDNVSLICNDCILDTSEADGLSECVCVCDEQDCTSLLQFGATRPTFGNYFDESVLMEIRVGGRLRNSETPVIEMNAFKATTDFEVQPYNNLNRMEEFSTVLIPEWVHNTLAVAGMHPIFYIDGVRYTTAEIHTPAWDASELAAGASKVKKYNQANLRNTY